ncbi:MAG TPA: DUF488 domain-containing protein [Solirubrobacteraceae bacterium]
MPERAVWTIGHSNHDFDAFASLLSSERIAYVVDVRSYPYSRIAPQFNREQLADGLAERGFGYMFLGAELGGRPDTPEHYDEDGHALYAPMAERPDFQAALTRVCRGAGKHRIVLMCSEADPTHCHRRLLVGRVLAELGVQLRHILPTGRVESESRVALPGENAAQSSLLPEEVPWRSTQSVSRRARLSASSAG